MTGNEAGDALAKPSKVDRASARKKDWIANQLRRVYDEALQEEIPDDMLKLLGKLDDTAGEP